MSQLQSEVKKNKGKPRLLLTPNWNLLSGVKSSLMNNCKIFSSKLRLLVQSRRGLRTNRKSFSVFFSERPEWIQPQGPHTANYAGPQRSNVQGPTRRASNRKVPLNCGTYYEKAALTLFQGSWPALETHL